MKKIVLISFCIALTALLLSCNTSQKPSSEEEQEPSVEMNDSSASSQDLQTVE